MRTGRKRRTLPERAETISSVHLNRVGTQDHATAIRKIKRAEKYALENYAEVIKAATERAKEGSAKHTELLEKYVVEPHKEEARERTRQRFERPRVEPAIIRMAIAQLPVGSSGQQMATMAVTEIRGDVLPSPGLSQAGQSEVVRKPLPGSYALEPGERLCERCTLPYKPTRPHVQRFCSICGEENDRQKARERKTRFLAKHPTTA